MTELIIVHCQLNRVTVTVVTVKIKTVDNSQLTIINFPYTLSITNSEFSIFSQRSPVL